MMADHIHEYWESQGDKYGETHWASWGDNWMIDLEIGVIAKHLAPGNRVLDVGCGNGYSAIRQLKSGTDLVITGIDYAASLIEAARRSKDKQQLGSNIRFDTGDVRNLGFDDGRFDVVYSTRVIINLPNWEEQKKAIAECVRVTRPGGKILLLEAFWEPLMLLNSMRALVGLPPLVEHDFNRYLKKNGLADYLGELGLAFEVEDYSSIYYLGSRFLRELVTNPADFPGFSNPINKLFYEIEQDFSGGGFGIQQAFVISKPF